MVRVPVDAEQSAGLVTKTAGAAGPVGAALITLTVAGDTQPELFLTVMLYVPAGRAVKIFEFW